jgi:exo-1,4-beta-D-glucosaminidase
MRTRWLVAFVAAIGLAQIALAQSDTLHLRDNWRLQSTAKVEDKPEAISSFGFQTSGWYATNVPTTVLAALVENKVYPDPYFGANLKSIPGYREGRWLVMPPGSPFRKSWWFRSEFAIPASYRGQILRLHLEGINYQANVWLNGRKIADSAQVIGMFRRFEFPVTDQARPGDKNVLAIEIIAPGQGPERAYTTKQIEATTGWDDHNPQPPDLNMGLWRDVYIKATGPVSMRHPYVSTKVALPGLESAALTVSAELTNETDAAVSGELNGEIESIRFAQPVRLAARERKIVTFAPDRFNQLTISRPRLWWPVGMGAPELYDAKLAFSAGGKRSDALSVRFGIRDITTRINEEGWRAYYVNGKRALIRGGAWMTSDMLIRLNNRRYEALIRYAKEANLNMLRSEGFSIRETDEFYDLCDRYGVMVTQQIFGRNLADEKLALDCIEDMILRIRNHASLAHFLGHDETYPTPTLDKAYQDLIAKYTPERTYQPHSGAFDVKERFKTGGTRTGTRELWTYATPAHYYLRKDDGAWGFAQSGGIGGVVSPYESMRRMMPKEDLWPPFTPTWSLHTVIQGGKYFEEMVKALETRYGKPTGIEEFCLRSQAMNYESARGMFEAYGRNKYSALGITPWKYNAAWPASPTWQYIDWNLIAGGAYYGAKRAVEPVHVQYSYDDQSIWVVNNSQQDHRGLKVTARVLDFDLKERFSKTASVDVAADGKSNALTIAWPKDISKTFFVLLKLEDGSAKVISENRYWLSTVPDIPGKSVETRDSYKANTVSLSDFTALQRLDPTEVHAEARFDRSAPETVGRVEVVNRGKNLAFLLNLAILKGANGDEIAPSYWNDNYVMLLPGEKRELTVRFDPAELQGTEPVLRANWWNMRR